MLNEEERYKIAKQRVDDLKGFYIHLFLYLVGMAFLLAINIVVTGMGFFWMIFPAAAWGMGLAIHGFIVLPGSPIGKEWEQRKIREVMESLPGGRKSKDDLFQ